LERFWDTEAFFCTLWAFAVRPENVRRMNQNNADDLQALLDAQQNAALAWQRFLSDISLQTLGHINPVPMVTILQAYRATAQKFADLYPDNPFPKACVEQADVWLKEVGSAQ
jgi:hypothetical protein